MERDQRVPRRPGSQSVGVFKTGIAHRRSLSRHAGQGTPTSGQFSRWGPAPLRAAQRDGVYHAAVRMTLNAGVPAEKGPPRNWGSFPPPAFGGLCRPEVGVPLPARRTALLGFSRGAAFTQQLGHGAPVSDRHRAGARNPHRRRRATPISRLQTPPASRGSARTDDHWPRQSHGQERRSPTGIARERETRTDDAAPRQSHGWSAGLRPASRGSAKPAPTTLAMPISRPGAPVSDRHRAGARNPRR